MVHREDDDMIVRADSHQPDPEETVVPHVRSGHRLLDQPFGVGLKDLRFGANHLHEQSAGYAAIAANEEALVASCGPDRRRVVLSGAPALMGNTVVWKPASSAVYAPYHFMKLLQEAGLPDGVINFVPGSGGDVGDTILASPDWIAASATSS